MLAHLPLASEEPDGIASWGSEALLQVTILGA
jgi:hypothetical protein